MIVNFVFLSKIKKAYISKPFLVTIFFVCSYLRTLSACQPTPFAKVTDLRITQYPLFLTQRHQQDFNLTYRPYDKASLSHSSYLFKVSLTAPQPSVPFSYLLRRKDETPNVNFTNSKLFANSIYLWYNNTNKHKKTKYRKQLSKMETHFAGFLFSKTQKREHYG